MHYLDLKFSKLEETEMIGYLICVHQTIKGWNKRAGAGLAPAGIMA